MIEISADGQDVKMGFAGRGTKTILIESIGIMRALYDGLNKIDSKGAEIFRKSCMDGGFFNSEVTTVSESYRRIHMEEK